MTTENSANEPRYARGENPRSLANLKAPWTTGSRPNPTGQAGPLITPALKRLAQRGMTDILELAANPKNLTAAEAIALMLILKASTDGHGGDRAREQVLERLDGINKLVFEVTVSDSVKLAWNDNPGE